MSEIEQQVAKALHEKMSEQDIHGYLSANLDCAELARAAIAAMPGWQPIDSAPKGDLGVDDLILIGHIQRGRVVWAIAAQWSVAMYGYVHCASRSGWASEYMPMLADGAGKPKAAGTWIIPTGDMAPTHWMPLHVPTETEAQP